jgi:hypothetical protein
VPRTYLFVPPEEKCEVRGLGARWDTESKRWYIESEEASARFSRWLQQSQDDEEYTISSAAAYVAEASTNCQRCDSRIDVICLHCESGTVLGEPLARFTVFDVWAMDDSLTQHLEAWPNYRRVDGRGDDGTVFANHCPRCGSPQEDMYLHSEPDQPFFNVPRAEPGNIKLTALAGSIQLSGNEHFEVD